MENEQNEQQVKNITIRGIDSNIYDEFSSKVKSLNMNIGDAITKMMGAILSDFDETFETLSSKNLRSRKYMNKIDISHHSEIVITEQDLIESDSRVSFNHIENLVFDDNITKEIFEKHVRNVNHCTFVKLPKTVPKLLAMSKIFHCDNVSFGETKSENNVEEMD